jgi:uncharacterized protein DUF6760
MPRVRNQLPRGTGVRGGVIGHPPDALFGEMADLAQQFHWPADQLMGLTHHERRRWLREVARLEARAATAAQEPAWP